MAEFLVHSTMRLAARQGLFLIGEIKTGTIRSGMVLHPGTEGTARIVSVEFVDHPGGRSQVALHIACHDTGEERFVETVCREGRTIEVVESDTT